MNPTKNPGPLGETFLHPREKRSTKFRGCLSCVVNVDSHCLSPGSFLLMAPATPLHLRLSKRLRGASPSDCDLRRMCLGKWFPLLRQHTLAQLQGTSVRVGYPLNFSFIKNHLKYAFEGGEFHYRETLRNPPSRGLQSAGMQRGIMRQCQEGEGAAHRALAAGVVCLPAQLFPNPSLLPE